MTEGRGRGLGVVWYESVYGILGVRVRMGVGDGERRGWDGLKLSSRLYTPLRGSGDVKGEKVGSM